MLENLSNIPLLKLSKQQKILAGLSGAFFTLVGVTTYVSSKPSSIDTDTPPVERSYSLEGEGFVPHVYDPEPVEIVQPLEVKDLFEPVIDNVDPEEARRKAAKRAFIEKSNQGLRRNRNIIKVTYEDESKLIKRSNYQFPHLYNLEADYSHYDEPRTTTSYPTDLSRVLPMTEVIPAILLDEIKSELAGEVVRVSIPQKVYSYHKNNILIPPGTIAIGRYRPLQKVGDTRLDIEFYRMITPEGINIQIKGFAVDQEGSQGITGVVDNKNLEKFGSAGIVAALQGAAQLTVDVNDDSQKAAADAISAPLNEVVAQVLSESINIAPTVRIKKGSPLNIKFNADIWFPSPRDPNTRYIQTREVTIGETSS